MSTATFSSSGPNRPTTGMLTALVFARCHRAQGRPVCVSGTDAHLADRKEEGTWTNWPPCTALRWAVSETRIARRPAVW
jgi:hypothetical protein